MSRRPDFDILARRPFRRAGSLSSVSFTLVFLSSFFVQFYHRTVGTQYEEH